MGYKLFKFGVRRLSDGAFIPQDDGNMDWREYQEWLAKGNQPEAADPDPVPVTSKREAAIEALLAHEAAKADAPAELKDYARK